MPVVARIATPIALDRNFDYAIPPELAATITLGARVLVPFGRRQTTGIVVELVDHSERKDLKSILSMADAHPLLDASMLGLARWIADYYVTPLEQVLRAVLPAPVRKSGAHAKTQLTVTPARDRAAAGAATLTPKQLAVMEQLWAHGAQPLQALARDLDSTAAPVRVLERKGWVTIADAAVGREPPSRRTLIATPPLALNPDQAAALAIIVEVMGQSQATGAAHAGGATPSPEGATAGEGRGVAPSRSTGVVLLHGVTGSGKTEVYLQAIARALEAGGGAIVLVPEISLTPQTIDRFVARFGQAVAVLHSHLSDGERYDEWHRIRSGEARIVVGARSAVFAPVRPLGIIVVDEEHEPSYKQEDAPRYNARDVAVMRGHFEHCAVVLGSATPALESWINARKGKYRLATLPVRVDDRKMPAVRVVDMRINAERTGHVSVFSKELIDAIQERLSRAEQTILFLNRRGFATSLVCPKCGFKAECEHCSVAVTYHRQDERLRCHLCGSSRAVPALCPQCQDPAFRYAGFGTQRVEGIVKKCFAHAKIVRMDADATTTKGSHDRILGDFRAGKIDILIGTQMIAKGLDFPNVTLVGVVQADLSLHLPDFRAGERTYQLLAQVAGRAGRGFAPGEVIIQTYTPHHPALQAVRRNDYAGFCDQELEFRRELGYPPYARLTCVTLRGTVEARVSFYATLLHEKLTPLLPGTVRLSDPCPAPIARVKRFFRFQLMLHSPAAGAIAAPLREVLRAHPPPADIKVSIDVDAMSLL
ncbi:MAG: primosomal protein N' [Lentisphaerae bacterium]|nr:primosomal protein N' [Lentisphaerota bacterium]